MRTIDADALIEDLEYDVELDARQLDDMDFVGIERELVQFDKDCKQNAIDLLQHAPTIEERKWIPCSEMLPDGQTEVIVSCCDDAGDSKYNYTSFGWMTRDGEYWIVDNDINYYVNAWMPLPEPWRGEE